jgi:hypothetical protein
MTPRDIQESDAASSARNVEKFMLVPMILRTAVNNCFRLPILAGFALAAQAANAERPAFEIPASGKICRDCLSTEAKAHSWCELAKSS